MRTPVLRIWSVLTFKFFEYKKYLETALLTIYTYICKNMFYKHKFFQELLIIVHAIPKLPNYIILDHEKQVQGPREKSTDFAWSRCNPMHLRASVHYIAHAHYIAPVNLHSFIPVRSHSPRSIRAGLTPGVLPANYSTATGCCRGCVII